MLCLRYKLFLDAKRRYKVSYKCCICGEEIDVDTKEKKKGNQAIHGRRKVGIC